MDADVKIFLKFAKKNIDRKRYNAIKKLKDEEEMIQALQYVIAGKLEREMQTLEKQVKNKEKLMKDVFVAKTKLIMLQSKLKNFKASFSDEDYNKVKNLFSDIKKEIQNV